MYEGRTWFRRHAAFVMSDELAEYSAAIAAEGVEGESSSLIASEDSVDSRTLRATIFAPETYLTPTIREGVLAHPPLYYKPSVKVASFRVPDNCETSRAPWNHRRPALTAPCTE